MNLQKYKTEYLAGVHTAIPVIFAFIPVGIAFAIMAKQGGFTSLETSLMSITVFAGASQMMAAGMYAQGAGIFAIILATFLINLRHLIMSVCVMNRMQKTPTGLRLAAAFAITDESFAFFTTGAERKYPLAYFLGLVTVTYLSWIGGTAIGAIASDFLPELLTASFGIALYAMFISIITPDLHQNYRLLLLVVICGIINSVLNQFIASSWALIISTLLCAFMGTFFVELDEDYTTAKGGENNE